MRKSDLPFEKRLNIVEMTAAMKGSIHAELSACGFYMFFDLFNEVRRECVEFSVNLLCREEGKLGSSARIKRVTNDFERIVDCHRVDRGWIKALCLPAVQNNKHTMIPKGEVREQGGDRPAVIGGQRQICVGKPVYKRFQSLVGFGVFFGIRECHELLLVGPVNLFFGCFKDIEKSLVL